MCLYFASDKDGGKGFAGYLCGGVYFSPEIKMVAKIILEAFARSEFLT
jgi:hypothetical protein